MNEKSPQADFPKPTLFIGIDWGDQKHAAYVIDRHGKGSEDSLEQTPEAIDAWLAEKLQQSNGQSIGIILEQKRGALIHALMFRDNVILYPINPKQLSHYRQSYSTADCKGDESDARLLARMLRERHHLLKPWRPDDERTRTLARLCETRRQLVDERTRIILQLTSQLKAYYPLALDLRRGRDAQDPFMLELLLRWPDPRKLRRADRRILHRVLREHGYHLEETRQEMIEKIRSAKLLTQDNALIEPTAVMVQALVKQIPILQKAIGELEQKIEEEMSKHSDATLFTTLPGAGKVLAPRLLVAFGSQRDRYANAEEIATFSGIAPVTKQSGKSRTVRRRYACPKYLRQTFHEFANSARKWCPWSRAYYDLQRSRGMKHNAAVRKLAYRWIRILFRIWQTRRPYAPDAYLATIKVKNPAIVPFLKIEKTEA